MSYVIEQAYCVKTDLTDSTDSTESTESTDSSELNFILQDLSHDLTIDKDDFESKLYIYASYTQISTYNIGLKRKTDGKILYIKSFDENSTTNQSVNVYKEYTNLTDLKSKAGLFQIIELSKLVKNIKRYNQSLKDQINNINLDKFNNLDFHLFVFLNFNPNDKDHISKTISNKRNFFKINYNLDKNVTNNDDEKNDIKIGLNLINRLTEKRINMIPIFVLNKSVKKFLLFGMKRLNFPGVDQDTILMDSSHYHYQPVPDPYVDPTTTDVYNAQVNPSI